MLLARNWWVFLFRGLLAILFGVAALLFPAAAFLSLVLVFGAFTLLDGIFALVAAFAGSARSENWWWLVVEGVFGILVGALTIWQPAAMGLAWIFIIAAWAIVTGIFEILTAIRLRKEITGEWLLVLGGALSIAFGVLAFMSPQSGAFAIGTVAGLYGLMFGLLFVFLAFRLRKFRSKI